MDSLAQFRSLSYGTRMVQIERELYQAAQATTTEELCVAADAACQGAAVMAVVLAGTTLLMNKHIFMYFSFLLIHLCISLTYIGHVIFTWLCAFLHDAAITLSMVECAPEISL